MKLLPGVEVADALTADLVTIVAINNGGYLSFLL